MEVIKRDHNSFDHYYFYSKSRSTLDLEYGRLIKKSPTSVSRKKLGICKSIRDTDHFDLSKVKRCFIFIHGLWSDTSNFFASSTSYLERDVYSHIDDLDLVISLQWKGHLLYRTNQKITEEKGLLFGQILGDIRRQLPYSCRIDLMAHSMGNQVMIHALNSSRNSRLPKLTSIIMMAPDLHTKVFQEDLNEVTEDCEKVYLFYNNRDNTLAAANILFKQKRLGIFGTEGSIPSILEKFDYSHIRDFQSTPGKYNHHRYYYDSPTVKKQLVNVLNK